MNIPTFRLQRGFVGRILALPLALAGFALLISPAARAEQAAVDVVRQYQADLLATMKQGPSLGYDGRFKALQGPVVRAFDLGFIAQRAAGASWASFTDQQKKRYLEAFTRYSVAQHASRFKSFGNERFEMVGTDDVGRGYVRVRTQIVTGGAERVSLDYLMSPRAGGWKIVDVFAKGTISEVATRRADFAPVLKSQGPDGLIRELEAKAAAARGGS
jgi:phospholipid transport system substrate-binding protein